MLDDSMYMNRNSVDVAVVGVVVRVGQHHGDAAGRTGHIRSGSAG